MQSATQLNNHQQLNMTKFFSLKLNVANINNKKVAFFLAQLSFYLTFTEVHSYIRNCFEMDNCTIHSTFYKNVLKPLHLYF